MVIFTEFVNYKNIQKLPTQKGYKLQFNIRSARRSAIAQRIRLRHPCWRHRFESHQETNSIFDVQMPTGSVVDLYVGLDSFTQSY